MGNKHMDKVQTNETKVQSNGSKLDTKQWDPN